MSRFNKLMAAHLIAAFCLLHLAALVHFSRTAHVFSSRLQLFIDDTIQECTTDCAQSGFAQIYPETPAEGCFFLTLFSRSSELPSLAAALGLFLLLQIQRQQLFTKQTTPVIKLLFYAPKHSPPSC